MAEAGLPGVEAEAFWGMLAPANTPAPILARMEAAVRRATELPEVRERLVNIMGIEMRNEGPAAFGAFLDRQIEVWGRVIRENDIRPD
jgi:tripartite-type tricarboxylate transporter receptor subunit TctC